MLQEVSESTAKSCLACIVWRAGTSCCCCAVLCRPSLPLLPPLRVPRCHIILSNLRKPGEKGYKIPTGFLFNYITCANYTAEIWGWILFTIGTRTLTAGLFTAAGAFQMAEWARGKHRRLQKVREGRGWHGSRRLHRLCACRL